MTSRLVLAACCLGAWASAAAAAECGCEPLTAKEAKKRAEAVFTATVIDSHREMTLEGGGEWRVRLKVGDFWKGDPGEVVILYTDGPCAVAFEPGQTYLVYAARQPGRGRLVTDTCRSTAPLDARAGEVEKLGKPKRRPARES